mgnify:CR=1 FL=1
MVRRGWPRSAVFVLACAGLSTGWMSGSGCENTHGRLAQISLQAGRLTPAAYPDLNRFRDRLVDGASSESGHPNMPANGPRGDSLATDWREARAKHRQGRFADAYFQIGVMGHMVQDNSLPSHAYDINHVAYLPPWRWPLAPQSRSIFGDRMEVYATVAGVFAPNAPGFAWFNNPAEAYPAVIADVRAAVMADAGAPPLWTGATPAAQPAGTNGWRDYWVAGEAHQETIFIPGLATGSFTFRGRFGRNQYPFDTRNRMHPVGWTGTYYTPFLNRCAERAVRFTAGCWAAASRRLPPLVSLANPDQIVVDENRLPTLRSVSLRVDGVEVWRRNAAALAANADTAQLPWRATFVHGATIPPGQRVLQAIAVDADGNVGATTVTVTR